MVWSIVFMVNMKVGYGETRERGQYRTLLFAAVTFICDHPDIRAISFVGSDTAVSVSQGIVRKRQSVHCRAATSMNEARRMVNVYNATW